MSSYKDEESRRSSDTLDDVEMQEREDDYKDGDRLLADEKGEPSDEIEHKEEWHLRTGWVILFSISMMMLVFLGMVAFAKTFIAKKNVIDYFEASPDDFRRPASEYILDHKWDFDAAPKVRRYHWTITDIMANPDGVYRPMITINGQFPGPMIECNEGDTIVIEVDNRGVNATSLHFHGIFQNGTNWMDGTTGITQCPIAPGRKFRYEFTVNGQSGTYYYHGHQAVQIADGLYGPLIIHSKEEKSMQKIEYDTDRVVMLQDYYHELSSGLLIEALEPGSESSPIPDGALINGINTRDCSLLPHRSCDNTTATIPSFYLIANAYHRLRFVNVGAFAWFQVSMDEHEFAITEVDGTDIMPSYESRMMISPAQRYSMVINTNHASLESFWLRARMVTHCWKTPELPANGAAEVRAVVRYVSEVGLETSSPAEPTSKNWDKSIELQCKDMNTTPYIPVAFEPAPAVADHSYFLRSNLEIGDWRLERGFFNKSTFRPDLQHPTLHRTIEGLSNQNESFTSMSAIEGVNSVSYDQKHDFLIQHSGIKVIDIVIQNFDEGNHPMHLHGHKVWVLGQGHGPFPGYEALGLQAEGKGILEGHEHALDNLIRRDVATVEGFGWLAIRFVADNPGVWAFHCHLMWHGEAGMVMQFLDRVDEVEKWGSVPDDHKKLCEADISELEKGAVPKDDIWFGFGVGG
ncbi:putative iron transport multicopper oxidase fio1 precursor protein [Rutstroemia sp. NJR-2017a BVV2]|nr:putative iron transport multicopper oxidase fio1 precursor protein [Rutstroemia sp. NJR-2017a BVV2]PQE18535.1 putative iron transport multicopper oxidase fio1 precursor protein [Rutstroemia sp. NJR-2017a BVV2]